MNIQARWDDSELLLRMKNGQRKLLFAVAGAINFTAKKIQQAEFARVDSKFHIRTPATRKFFFGSESQPGGVAARLGKPPDIKAGRMFREVFTGAEAARGKRSVILPLFEQGGTRTPELTSTLHPGKLIVPLEGRPARPSARGVVPPAFTMAGLAFRAYKRGRVLKHRRRGKKGGVPDTIFTEFGRIQREALAASSNAVQWKGKQRTFILHSTREAPLGGVFQRIGPRRGDIRMIYAFEKSVPIDHRLGFVATAQATADRWFGDEMKRQIADAVAHEKAAGRL